MSESTNKSAFVFPGQGSQSVGMLKDLALEYSSVSRCFEKASDALGYDLWKLVQEDDGSKLNQTQITQPALLTASVACWEVLLENVKPSVDFLAGHSLGEYSALTCAGVFDLADAVKLVEARGVFMQEAVPNGTGAMFAIIGLDDELIIQSCEQVANQTGEIVSAVNFNSPGQVVIAGSKHATELAASACKDAGAKRALPLAVSVPSHCALMQPAADRLSALLSNTVMNKPLYNVVNNVDVSIETDIEKIKDALLRQLYMPVRWTESVRLLTQNGVSSIIEVGPGKVLSGLNKRIDKTLNLKSVSSPSDFS
ncbi:ACP S-malonyltransferase [Glaciecola sp. KUL10]|uniref:ACP S-malonyltransferase n=1 Tax=Glaciecola sp. (strain KUL10) TaxID=2161813 RepID=UPI000D7822DA|nr:ACP S-malonyltransferase [Glaciecola sp. KUL10]GBL03036.1 malonyl CoA-acyl carrier protein transacylase [Glaciecola sp. KUL10]